MTRLVAVECNPDVELAKSFGYTRKEIFHAGNISAVCKHVNKYQESIGIIDEDPFGTHPKLLQSFRTVNEERDIKIIASPEHGNLIFMLRPRLEEWILKAADSAQLDITSFGLPNTPNELHSIINSRAGSLQKLISTLETTSQMFISLKKSVRPQQKK